jgi:hypothetical protein
VPQYCSKKGEKTMKQVKAALMAEIWRKICNGEIRQEHLERLERNPDCVFNTAWDRKFLRLLRSKKITYFDVAGDKPFYVYRDSLYETFVVCGKKTFGPFSGNVGSYAVVGGEPFFLGGPSYSEFSVYWGKKVYGPFEGMDLISFCAVDEKPLFIAKKSSKFSVYWGEEQYDVCDSISHKGLYIVDGKPLYAGCIDGKHFVFWGRKKHGPYDESVVHLSAPNNIPLYLVEDKSLGYMIYHGEEKYGPFSRVYHLSSVEGMLLYYFEKKDGSCGIVYGDEEIDLTHDSRLIYSWNLADGKICYYYKTVEEKEEYYVVWGDKKYGPYEGISHFFVEDGAPFYLVHEGLYHFFVWGDITWDTTICNLISRVSFVDKKPLFVGTNSVTEKTYVFWGNTMSGEYGFVRKLSVVDDKPFFLASILGKKGKFVFWGEEKFGSFDEVFYLSVVGGKILIYAERDGRKFVCWGEDESRSYDNIYIKDSDDGSGMPNIFAQKGKKMYRLSLPIK